jgi:hypothetical protein
MGTNPRQQTAKQKPADILPFIEAHPRLRKLLSAAVAKKIADA